MNQIKDFQLIQSYFITVINFFKFNLKKVIKYPYLIRMIVYK